MKKNLLMLSGSLFLIISLFAFKPMSEVEVKSDKINWISIEEAIDKSEEAKKGFVIDVYTDWCKWCKTMDEQTFQNSKVVDYINENYYAVKLNAEQKEAITFDGKTYEYVQNGNKGINKFVLDLLDGRTSYPSTIILDKNMKNKKVIKGFKKADALLVSLKEENSKACYPKKSK